MATAIQFLRSSTPRLRPNPADLAPGMPMVNIAPEEPGLYFKTSDSKLFKVGPTYIGTVPPNDGATGFAGNTIGEQWLDVTINTDPILKIWDGTVWRSVSGGGSGSAGGAEPSPTPPSGPEVGDLWYDTSTDDLLFWNGTGWTELTAQVDWNESNSSSEAFIKNKPTVTSEFSNDGENGSSKYITEVGVENLLNGLNLDGSTPPGGTPETYLKSGDNVSELVNDPGYVTDSELTNILNGLNPDGSTPPGTPETYLKSGDNVSELVNDPGYVTDAELTNILNGLNPDGSTPPGGTTETYLKSGDNVSELVNDPGYVTDAELTNILNGLNPDGSAPIGGSETYLKAGDDVSELVNDAQYITALEAPVQTVNSKTGAVVLNLDDINDVSAGSPSTAEVLTWNGNAWSPSAPVSLPPSIEFQGTVDCASAAPANPTVGDAYVQTAVPGPGPVTPDASWTGLSGSINDGAYLIYGDGGGTAQWFLGNNIASQVQSDWDESNTSSLAYISNKPNIYDSTVTIKESDGTSVGTFSTNQNAGSDIILPAAPTVNDSTVTIKESDGTSVGTFSTNQASGSDITLPAAPTVNDSTVTIKKSDGTNVGSFSTNQGSGSDITLPAINDSTVTIKKSDGTNIGSFSTNQASGSDITLPASATVNDANLTLTVDANNVKTNTVFSANASADKSLTIGAGTLTIKNSGGTSIGTFSANQSANAEITIPPGMIEPTQNGSFVRKKSGSSFTWEAAPTTPNLQAVSDVGATTTNKITAGSLVASDIASAAAGTYPVSSSSSGNVMPLDLRKLPTLPIARSVITYNYSVTVNNPGSGNIYYLNGNAQQAIEVIIGDEIIFDYSDDSNIGHSLVIYSDAGLTTVVTSGVTDNAASEVLSYVTDTEGTFYYDCSAHPGMGSVITVTSGS